MRALLTALLAIGFAALGSCTPRTPAAAEPAIWRIADADSEIWLYGTVHMLPADLAWRGPRFEAAFAEAEELVTEADTRDAASAEIARLALELGALPAGQTLTLSAENQRRLERAARRYNLDPAPLLRQRAWLTALQLSYAAAVDAGHRPEAGVESVLMPLAQARQMRVSYLETPAQQVRILASLPPADEQRFLSLTLSDVEAGAAALAAMDQAWARGDTETLAALLEPQWREAGPAIHDAVILTRNRAWADEIARRLNGSGKIFIAVGAAHLVGDGNVIELLRARGIAVEGP